MCVCVCVCVCVYIHVHIHYTCIHIYIYIYKNKQLQLYFTLWYHSKSFLACGWDQPNWCENIWRGSKCACHQSWHTSDTNGKISAGRFPAILQGRKETAELPSTTVQTLEKKLTGILPVKWDQKWYPTWIQIARDCVDLPIKQTNSLSLKNSHQDIPC